MTHYYNEIDPYAASVLEELIFRGEIPYGVVDRRSIEDIVPSELAGYTQCHFFAGIAGWPLALKWAGIPESTRLWTGSCPCQPFSAAGKGAGFIDERHLWPAWFHLIRECRPAGLFGEQVASKAADPWIDLVHADLEGVGYAFGCVPFPAASVGAPHIRDRNYWVAYASSARLEGRDQGSVGVERQALERSGGIGRLAHDDLLRQQPAPFARLHNTKHHAKPCSNLVRLGHADSDGARWQRGTVRGQEAGQGRRGCGDDAGASGATDQPGPTNGFWRTADWLGCRDGKWRPVEPGTFPLVAGLSGRVGLLRCYGNAIVVPQAVEFVKAVTQL